jgi:hypothetical protein
MTRRRLSYAAIAGTAVFVVAFFVLGAAEGHGYSATKHYISDLGAPRAHHVVIWFGAQVLCAVTAAAFGFFALRPALSAAGRKATVAAWLIAGSVMVFDNITDPLFRLDCRLADQGCSATDQMATWHGKVHVYKFVVALVCTVAAPFVIASCMKVVDGWRGLVRPTRWFGVGFIVASLGVVAADRSDVQGLVQRVLAIYISLGVIALAARVASDSG